jgi:hypothetical protein
VSSRGELERRVRRELGHLPEDEVSALARILERLIEAYEPEPIVDRAVPLTDYAWMFRYPGGPEEPSVPEAQEALGLALEVYETILSRLPGEVRP